MSEWIEFGIRYKGQTWFPMAFTLDSLPGIHTADADRFKHDLLNTASGLVAGVEAESLHDDKGGDLDGGEQ